MNLELEVRSGPSIYACKEGILETLEENLIKKNIKRIIIVHGEKSWKAAQPFFPVLNDVESTMIPYAGECTDKEIARIADFARKKETNIILGIGGGKVLDVVKGAGNLTHKETILIPTLPSTCAAWTPLSVIYNEAGGYERYDIHMNNSWMVMIEPRIFLSAPLSYLRAGIGDTLAKWYEGNALYERIEERPAMLTIGHLTARQCLDVLLANSVEAFADWNKGRLSSPLLKVIETVIATGGLVGGFGDSYLRVAAAHSIHNGLTHVTATHHLLHGEKVAYGILVQLLLEKKPEEIVKLIPFYQAIQLPFKLKDIGLNENQHEEIERVAKYSVLETEDIHLLFPGIKKGDVTCAIMELEDLVQTNS
jgi:hydroxycarboxylate dehydrogenase A